MPWRTDPATGLALQALADQLATAAVLAFPAGTVRRTGGESSQLPPPTRDVLLERIARELDASLEAAKPSADDRRKLRRLAESVAQSVVAIEASHLRRAAMPPDVDAESSTRELAGEVRHVAERVAWALGALADPRPDSRLIGARVSISEHDALRKMIRSVLRKALPPAAPSHDDTLGNDDDAHAVFQYIASLDRAVETLRAASDAIDALESDVDRVRN